MKATFIGLKKSIILVAMFVLAAGNVVSQTAGIDVSSFGSSFYLAGGYGLPSQVRAECGYVLEEAASIALLCTGPYTSEAALTVSLGASARIFLPIEFNHLSPFFSVAYTSSSPGALLLGDSRREELSLTVGSLTRLKKGVHVRPELGMSQVNDLGWKFSWSLQVEFTLGEIGSSD